MKYFCPTIIIRHRKERLKKCSLRGLETREDLLFISYPNRKALPFIDEYVLLCIHAPYVLSDQDCHRGLLLLDGTWKLTDQMECSLRLPKTIVRRTLPHSMQTAYPRRQNQTYGLASVEALYIAYLLTKRDPAGLLDHYHWKEQFLKKNASHAIFNLV